MNFVYTVDYAVLNFLQDHLRCPVLDAFFGFVTHIGDGGLFWIALAALLLCFPKTRKIGCTMGIALILGTLTANLFLKPVVARVRPYENPAYADLIRLTRDQIFTKLPPDYSFPSGHALASFESSFSILLWNRKLGIPAVVLAFLIAFSRLYLYVHYFTDVLTSLLLGIGFAFAAYYLLRAVLNHFTGRQADKRA